MAQSFGTVLVKRKANERPKEWELRLRPICQKIRIVEKLLGGVHLMITGSRVAVRIYDADDIGRLEQSATDDDDPTDGIDGLCNFRDSYEHSIVFFVFPSGRQQRDQLGRRDSFFNAAQKSLLRRDKKTDEDDDGKRKHITRTAVVSDISQVIQALDSLVQSLAPEKREKRKRYFAQVASQKFLPGSETRPSQEVVANHVMKTFRTLGERFEMPEGDSSVVLSMLGSLVSVATANKDTLDDVPIRNASKELISRFFGTDAAADDVIAEDKMNEADEFYDDIDDSELLECPDPSVQNDGSQQNSRNAQFPPRNLAQNFEKATSGSIVQNSFSGDMHFTPMVPPRPESRQRPRNNAASSIFPGSHARQGHFHQRHGTGGYQQMTFDNGYGNSTNYPNLHDTSAAGGMHQHFPPPPGSRAGNYQSFHNGLNSEYQDTTQGYEGYSYPQSARYHTQQFM